MGIDINIYPERRMASSWESVCGSFRPLRDREMFQLIGFECGLPESPPVAPLYPLRGLPAELGSEAQSHAFITVDGDWRSEYLVTRADAEQWVAEGKTRWEDERQSAILDPDYFGHTWLTAAEYDHVLKVRQDAYDHDWWGLQALLRELERRGSGTRLVIWFDY